MIISLDNQRGVGKTTIASNITSYLAKFGQKILLAGPQGSVLQCQSIIAINAFNAIYHSKATFHKDLENRPRFISNKVIDEPQAIFEVFSIHI
jgi:nitrogenase subunit NifH